MTVVTHSCAAAGEMMQFLEAELPRDLGVGSRPLWSRFCSLCGKYHLTSFLGPCGADTSGLRLVSGEVTH